MTEPNPYVVLAREEALDLLGLLADAIEALIGTATLSVVLDLQECHDRLLEQVFDHLPVWDAQ